MRKRIYLSWLLVAVQVAATVLLVLEVQKLSADPYYDVTSPEYGRGLQLDFVIYIYYGVLTVIIAAIQTLIAVSIYAKVGTLKHVAMIPVAIGALPGMVALAIVVLL